MSSIGRFVTTLACAATFAFGAFAQDFGNEDREPPPRAGRISVIEGRMTYKNPDDADWSDAGINYPVGPGQSFATAPGTRSEIQLGGTTLRLDGRTTVTMLALDNDATAARLEDGRLAVQVSMIFDNEAVELETPDGRVSFREPGTYRVDAGVGAEPTRVVAFSGRAEIETRRGRQTVMGGSAYDVNDAGQVRTASTEMMSLDEWSRSRERVLASSTSERYVGDGTPGYQDLDYNGTWQDSVEYGKVWYPSNIPSDWAPYTTGDWIWVNPWGWTWVDAQPWGFAPFHYGRWVYYGGRWGWTPGERVRRPVFAPAVVGFGTNDAWRFRSRHDRPTHWVPLAPGEQFRPWYTRNDRYVRNLNRGNVGRAGISISINSSSNDRPAFANARPFDENRGRWGRGNDRGNDRGPGRNDGGRNDGNRIVITDPQRTTTPQAPGQPAAQLQDNTGRGGRTWSGRDFRRPNQQPGAPIQIAPTLQTPSPVTAPPNPVSPAPQLNAPTSAAPNSDAARMERWNRGGGDGNPNGGGRRVRTPPPPMPDPNGDTPRPQNNIGQGNVGQNNLGQGNAGQGNVGEPGGGRFNRGGFGRGRDNN